uniref:4a-hydroxytetrahydrobiopterin dehydratase n=1 Tax=Craspedostauros australis TaxID=1486917 RepID=A0A7R9WYI1_9STRA|mmetsp:Transcript_3785/g.10021  ORF Transcript_3785/g.10021 Transcript_3785/m.10021 type:complete len:182 (+) Transcript_3785:195-740(+)
MNSRTGRSIASQIARRCCRTRAAPSITSANAWHGHGSASNAVHNWHKHATGQLRYATSLPVAADKEPATALSADARVASLKKLSEMSPIPWIDNEDAKTISKTFVFADFNQAWSFMSRTALLAEKMDHHPEWSNVYNCVEVTLTTHDCDGVSLKDIDMAKAMERYAMGLMPGAFDLDDEDV